MRRFWRFRLAAVVGLATIAITACGGSSSSSGSSSASASSTGSASGGSPVKGGTVTILDATGGIDSLDPGYWYYQEDYAEMLRTTQRTLYGFTPTGTNPVPDLATALPVLSDANRTLTIHIRSGIHYSPPLQKQTVTSADIKYALQRCFLAGVGNGYAELYLSRIVGAPATPASKLPNITGIQAPDPTTLVIKTSVPVGVLANGNALALPCTVPVPESYAAKYDTGAQSTYGQHQVFVGPYMVKGADTGIISSSGYSAGRLLDLVRNPSWQGAADPLVQGNFNEIVFKGGNDITVASRQTLAGNAMMSGDFAAPPVNILQQGLTSSQKSQFHILPSDGIRHIGLNTTIAPLNNINFRKAIAAVINRNALRLTRGGPTLGTLATHSIPPGLLGFAEAGGDAGPGYDFYANPTGNLALAQSYMKKAGFPSGKYTGPPLLTIADNTPPASNTALAVQSQLGQLGIGLTFREVPRATLLSKFCSVPKAKVAICPTLGWAKDFNDSQTMIDPLFNGKNIVPSGNVNFAEANDPTLNAQMNAAEQLIAPAQRAAAWAKIDREVTGQVYVVPWLWDNEVTFASKDVHGVNWGFNGNTWDFGNSWLTKG